MKRTLIIIAFIFVFLILYFLESNFFSWYNIAGIRPNLFIIFSIFIGLYLGKEYGIVFGILFGFILDLFISKKVGFNSIMLGLSGLIGGIFDKNFSKDNKITFVIITLFVTIICETIIYLIQILIMQADINIPMYFKILGIESIFNVGFVIILYPLIQKTGSNIEEIFKGEKNTFMKYY